jgi:hypothetical protein
MTGTAKSGLAKEDLAFFNLIRQSDMSIGNMPHFIGKIS